MAEFVKNCHDARQKTRVQGKTFPVLNPAVVYNNIMAKEDSASAKFRATPASGGQKQYIKPKAGTGTGGSKTA